MRVMAQLLGQAWQVKAVRRGWLATIAANPLKRERAAIGLDGRAGSWKSRAVLAGHAASFCERATSLVGDPCLASMASRARSAAPMAPLTSLCSATINVLSGSWLRNAATTASL